MTKSHAASYPQADALAWHRERAIQPIERILLSGLVLVADPVLEAGVGQGRLLALLAKAGFTRLHGFDTELAALEIARRDPLLAKVALTRQDARAVAYRDGMFRYVIYLQQLLSLMDGDAARRAAANESFRVLQPGGTALFSFLAWTNRGGKLHLRLYVRYIRLLRLLLRSRLPITELSWLRTGGRLNWGALFDHGPHVRYFRVEEATDMLRLAGFTVLRAGSELDFLSAPLPRGRSPVPNGIYVVCTKPAYQDPRSQGIMTR